MNFSAGEVLGLVVAVVGGVGLAAACGLRVFLPMLLLSIAGKADVVSLGSGLDWIAGTPALVTFSVASVLEVTAYYVPWLDHALDVIAAPSSVVAGTLAVASQVTGMDPWVSWTVGIVAGGGTAALVQGGTMLLRGLSTLTTGGLANPVVSTVENVGAIILAVLAIVVPIVALLVLGVALFFAVRYYRRRRATARGAVVAPVMAMA